MCKYALQGRVPGSVHFGTWQFATRGDYENHLLKEGAVTRRQDIWENQALSQEVQRHWLSTAQTGCNFARVMVSNPQKYGWETVVLSHSPKEVRTQQWRDLVDAALFRAIHSPDCQVISLLFPRIVKPADLVGLLQSIFLTKHVTLEAQPHEASVTTVGLRVQVEDVMSWVLGFGPFDFMPTTRRSPVTDLTLRVKPKPEKGFEKLTPDRTATHLADVPLNVGEAAYQRLWSSTVQRTAIMRGEEPCHYSKARVTIALPTRLWRTTGLQAHDEHPV